MTFWFEAVARLTLDYQKGSTTSKHVQTEVYLEVSDNLKRSDYLEEDSTPTEKGIKGLTNALVHGLIGSIHQAHEAGTWDSAEHLKYIISELEKGFVAVPKISVEEYGKS